MDTSFTVKIPTFTNPFPSVTPHFSILNLFIAFLFLQLNKESALLHVRM